MNYGYFCLNQEPKIYFEGWIHFWNCLLERGHVVTWGWCVFFNPQVAFTFPLTTNKGKGTISSSTLLPWYGYQLCIMKILDQSLDLRVKSIGNPAKPLFFSHSRWFFPKKIHKKPVRMQRQSQSLIRWNCSCLTPVKRMAIWRHPSHLSPLPFAKSCPETQRNTASLEWLMSWSATPGMVTLWTRSHGGWEGNGILFNYFSLDT